MYALFPLLICAIACAMLGTWLVHDAGFRHVPAIALPGWLLIAVLPLILLAFVVAGWPGEDLAARARWMQLALVPVAALVLAAAVAGVFVLLRWRRLTDGWPSSGPAIVGRGLVLAAAAIITVTFLLSLLLAMTNSTLDPG